ncbi:hypothetical protein LJB42_001688 [Komagataella kurtzmanii]|nr:hypothetical protein LJB42_001688 [Komagataella kurtzmanii]
MTDVKSRLRPFGISFEKSLSDLIKGIRSNNEDPDKLLLFLEESIQECREELRANDLQLKSTAVLKLAYLEMYGFDMSWCSFQILEVMSSSNFQHKRIGYLAAMQIMIRNDNDDALMLMTNLLKKDLTSSNQVEAGLALSGIASIVTTELAHDVCEDIVRMLSHSSPFIRKKAVLAMFKIFLKYPDFLRSFYPRLIERLSDDDTSVVSATVNVVCELANKNPKNYVELAPQLYELLTSSKNNWMVIRLLKLFSSLSLVEPRLKKKMLPAILNILTKTEALSLVYECIDCILTGKMLAEDDYKLAELMVERLLVFFEADDANLKYVALSAFIKIMTIHRSFISQHSKVVLDGINDTDLAIREKALSLLDALVTEENITKIVSKMMLLLLPNDDDTSESIMSRFESFQKQQMAIIPKSFKLLVLKKIISICCEKNYQLIPNFSWYANVLYDFIKLNASLDIQQVQPLISEQFVNLALRVPSIRPELVSMCLATLRDSNNYSTFEDGLKDCIWIVGEYYDEYTEGESELEHEEDDEGGHKLNGFEIITDLTKVEFFAQTDPTTLSILIHNLVKVFAKFVCSLKSDWNESTVEMVTNLNQILLDWLEQFQSHVNTEVQERSASFIEVLKLIPESLSPSGPSGFVEDVLLGFFNGQTLKPVSYLTQQKITIPEDVDLDKPFYPGALEEFIAKHKPLEESDHESIYNYWSDSQESEPQEKYPEDDIERLERIRDDPFYIGMDTVPNSESPSQDLISIDSRDTPAIKKKPSSSKSKKKVRVNREKVLILDDDLTPNVGLLDLESESVSRNSGRSRKGLLIDSSNLDKFDINADSDAYNKGTNGGGTYGEYEVNQLVEEMKGLQTEQGTSSSKVKKKKKKEAGIGLEDVEGEPKKLKRKKKKKKAVIQE